MSNKKRISKKRKQIEDISLIVAKEALLMKIYETGWKIHTAKMKRLISTKPI